MVLFTDFGNVLSFGLVKHAQFYTLMCSTILSCLWWTMHTDYMIKSGVCFSKLEAISLTNCQILFGNNIWDIGGFKRPMWWTNVLVEFGVSNFIYATIGAIQKWANFVPQILTPSKFTLIYDLWFSFDRVQSPDHFGMSIFEIVKKLTELWLKYVCPYMVIGAILGLIWPLSPIFCDILDSNLF